MRYGSVCSGIEAASVAWHPLGWKAEFFSEIEAFPSALLADRWPSTPNLGDMTKFMEWKNGSIDLLVGGTPCQSFSVAGLRKGLADPRGNLALVFLAILDRFRPRWVVWENVPGVLSVDEGRAFGSFLGGLGQLGYGWAYRVLDAQYFGVPQRRRRVFVVGYLGDWRRAAAVLFERESLSGNPPPSRESRKGVARPITPGSPRGSGVRNDADTAENLIPSVARTLRAKGNLAHREDAETYIADVANSVGASPASHGSPNVANGQGNIVAGTLTARMGSNPMGAPEVDGGLYIPWPAEVAPTLNAAFGDKQGLEDQHALHGAGLFVPAKPICASDGQANASFTEDVAGNLNATNEAPYIAGPIPIQEIGKREGIAKTPSPDAEGKIRLRDPGLGIGKPGDPSYTLQAAAQHGVAIPEDGPTRPLMGEGHDAGETGEGRGTPILPVAFSSKDHGADAGEVAPTLRAGGHDGSHPNGGVPPAVAVDVYNGKVDGDKSATINAGIAKQNSAGGQVMRGMQVRRLTPRECERLQGFPDDYTLIQYRKKPAPDGPRYKALGNSMAVPVMRWIGERIDAVEAIK